MDWLKGWALKIGAVVVALSAALIYGLSRGFKAGKAGVEAADAKATVKSVKTARDVEQQVQSESDTQLDKDFNEWKKP